MLENKINFRIGDILMEHKKEDRRIRMTKLVIRESLIELMQQYPISKISVKMICETADINRSTFYAHYRDQYALLTAVQQEIITDIKNKIISTQFFHASNDSLPTLIQLLEYGRENASLIKILLSGNGDSFFQNELMQLVEEKMIRDFQGKKSLPPHILEYLKRFVLDGFLSIMRHWLDEGCSDEPEMIAQLMMKLSLYGTEGLYSLKF